MSASDVLVGLGGATMVIAGVKVIFATGKLVRGQEQLERSFSDHRIDMKINTREINDKLDDHHERLIVLEIAQGFGGDRRHLLRREHDQHLRDVRNMVNGDEP